MVLINIQMPRSCSECQYQYEFQGVKRCQLNYGKPMEKGWKENRAEWCQLRELPEREEVDEDDWAGNGYEYGWNSCIDEMQN